MFVFVCFVLKTVVCTKPTYFLQNWGIRVQLTIVAGPRAPPSVSSTSQRRTQNKSRRQCGDCSAETQDTKARELLTHERPQRTTQSLQGFSRAQRTQIQVVPGPEKKGPPGSPAQGGKARRCSTPTAVEHTVEKVV